MVELSAYSKMLSKPEKVPMYKFPHPTQQHNKLLHNQTQPIPIFLHPHSKQKQTKRVKNGRQPIKNQNGSQPRKNPKLTRSPLLNWFSFMAAFWLKLKSMHFLEEMLPKSIDLAGIRLLAYILAMCSLPFNILNYLLHYKILLL